MSRILPKHQIREQTDKEQKAPPTDQINQLPNESPNYKKQDKGRNRTEEAGGRKSSSYGPPTHQVYVFMP